MMERALPLGSVVKLDMKSNDKYMIVSRLLKNKDDGKYYDYCLCSIPVGVCENSPMFFAMHDQIKQLIFIGYQDETEVAVGTRLFRDRDKLIAMAEELSSANK